MKRSRISWSLSSAMKILPQDSTTAGFMPDKPISGRKGRGVRHRFPRLSTISARARFIEAEIPRLGRFRLRALHFAVTSRGLARDDRSRNGPRSG